MFKDVLSQANLVFGPGLALVLFFLVMCGAIAWIFRKNSKQYYQMAAAIPFREGRDEHEVKEL